MSWRWALLSVGIGILCGGFGALLVLIWTARLSAPNAITVALIGWVLTLLGWFVGARLSERAQRRMFLHQILNTARKEIVEAIRLEQDWANGLSNLGYSLRNALVTRTTVPSSVPDFVFWYDQQTAAHKKVYPERGAIHPLVITLEEYEVLFPETRHVRWQLARFALREISFPFTGKLVDLANPELREEAIAWIEQKSAAVHDYSALLEDLRRHIQNASLAQITGNQVTPRVPQDPKVPLVLLGPDGMLDVFENGVRWER